MSTITDMLMLTIAIVFVVDISGFTETWKGWLGKWLRVKVGRVRPFDCGLCSTFWTLTIWLLCTGQFSLTYWAFACVLAALSAQVGQVISLLRYAVDTLLRLINTKLLDKLWK